MRDDATVALNRKARHEFTIDDTFEAGLVLTGTEIKSIRAGKANIANAYARSRRARRGSSAPTSPRSSRGIGTTTTRSGPASCCSTASRSMSC